VASAITDELRAVIGREWPPRLLDVDASSIRMWARAVGFDDLVFYDEAVARERGFPRLPAPPGFLGTPRWRPDEEEPGPPIRGLHPGFTRSLNGGTEVEYHGVLLAGDVLVATTVVTDVKEREGKVGPMLIFSRETSYRRDGELVATMRQTVINY
jgi:peroxisomal enoyl-CoA hydratase 2